MHIVIFTGLAYSLVNFRQELLEELVRRGYRVTALAPSNVWTQNTKDNEMELIGLTLAKIGIEFKVVDLERENVSILASLANVVRLTSTLNALKPDIIIATTVKASVIGMFAGFLARVPKRIVWLTGLGALFSPDARISKFKRLIGIKSLSFALSTSSKVVVLNNDNKKELEARGLARPGKTIVIPEGVSLSRFVTAPAPDRDYIIILYIGRLLIDKGLRDFIEAAKIVHKLRQNVTFQIVGPYDINPASISRDELALWQSEGIVQYLGPKDSIAPYLQDCDIFCLPSYHEGIPRTVLEAMAIGRPIVTTLAPGCKDTIEDGIQGFLVPIKKPDSLAKAILRLIDDRQLRITMGIAARERVSRYFDGHTAAIRFCDCLKIEKLSHPL